MNVLITGANGFVGKNLVEALKNVCNGNDRTHPELEIGELYLYDIDTDKSLLDTYCEKADFVFHLAGVNRPQNPEEFMQGNFGFASELLEALQKHNNTCPIVVSSSIQATLVGLWTRTEVTLAKADLFRSLTTAKTGPCTGSGGRT